VKPGSGRKIGNPAAAANRLSIKKVVERGHDWSIPSFGLQMPRFDSKKGLDFCD